MWERTGVRFAIGAIALVVLAVATIAGGADDRADGPSLARATTTSTGPEPTSTTTRPFVPVEPVDQAALVWAPRGVADDLADDAARLDPELGATSTVLGDRIMFVSTTDETGLTATTAPDGLAYPLDALAVDPDRHRVFVSPLMQKALHSLGDGEAVLGSSSARFRRIGVGGTIELRDGSMLTVRAIVPDQDVGGAEVLISLATAAEAGVVTPRFVLVDHGGDLSAVQAAYREAHPADEPVRVVDTDEVRFARHGDGVLTQIEIKTLFDEFAFAEGDGVREFARADEGFVDDQIGSTDVPIIGRVECHREILGSLRSALTDVDDLQRRLRSDYLATTTTTTTTTTEPPTTAQQPGSTDDQTTGSESTTTTTEPPLEADPDYPVLLEADADLGCYNPRQIGQGGPTRGVSRHAWGVAIDLRPPRGAALHDPRVIEIFARWGFTNGAAWLSPDPPHFEWNVAPDR